MDSGLLRILSCAAPRPAQLAGLCGFHAASALEGALPTAVPKEGQELSDSVVGILSFRPGHHTLLLGGVYPDAPTIVSIRSHTMDLERRDT
jgi:hypothetical protein